MDQCCNMLEPKEKLTTVGERNCLPDYLTVLDLFSGPGGLSEGFIQARNHNFRFKIVVANDYDSNVAETYEKNHPETEFVFGSITEEKTKKKIQTAIKRTTGQTTVDAVIGGPPCKGFSLANKMSRDMRNPMNHLIWHFLEMVRRVRPTALVMENVPGIMAMRGGKVVESLLSEFQSLGYQNAEAWLLNSAEYGVPQVRRRAFLVGSKSKIKIEKPLRTHTSPEEVKKKIFLFKYTNLITAIGDLPKIPTGDTYAKTDMYSSPPKNDFQYQMRRKSKKVTNHVVTKNTPIVIKRFKAVPPGGNWEDIPISLMQVDGNYTKIEKAHSMIYKRLVKNSPSITITNFRKGMMIHPTQHRLLSVREAARVQTFPDHFEFMGGLSSQQQQVSDAVPIMLARKVAESVLLHLHQIIKLPDVV